MDNPYRGPAVFTLSREEARMVWQLLARLPLAENTALRERLTKWLTDYPE